MNEIDMDYYGTFKQERDVVELHDWLGLTKEDYCLATSHPARPRDNEYRYFEFFDDEGHK